MDKTVRNIPLERCRLRVPTSRVVLLCLLIVEPHLGGLLFAQSGLTIDLRPPSARDVFFKKVAQDFNAGHLCEKISPRAHTTAGFTTRGYQISYWRSGCFYSVAVKTKNIELCGKVKTISTWFLDGSKISTNGCVEEIQAGRRWNVASPVPPEAELAKLMNEIGYDDKRLMESKYKQNPYLTPVYKFYSRVRQAPEFSAKVEALPSYTDTTTDGKIREPNIHETLYQMVAIDNNEPPLCEKISATAFFRRRAGDRRRPLRSQCFYSIAENSATLSLCEAIPRTGSFGTDEFYNRENCEKNVNWKIQGLQRGISSGTRMGPVVYTDIWDFVKILSDLGYKEVHDFGAEDAGGYHEYYRCILFSRDPKEKEEFLHKVEQMSPSVD